MKKLIYYFSFRFIKKLIITMNSNFAFTAGILAGKSDPTARMIFGIEFWSPFSPVLFNWRSKYFDCGNWKSRTITAIPTIKNPILFRAIGALLISIIMGSCCVEGFRNTVDTIPKEEWVSVLNPFFSVMEIHIDSYAPDERRVIRNGSHISIFGNRVIFSGPYIWDSDFGGRHFFPTYRVLTSNFNQERISVDALENRFSITIAMENTNGSFYYCTPSECRLSSAVEDLVFGVYIEITVEGGQVTYNAENIMVRIIPTTRECRDEICVYIPSFAQAMQDQFRRIMALPEIRVPITEALTTYVRNEMDITGPIGQASILPNGSLIINHSFPDISCD